MFSAQRGFVAQICNLPYRRFVIGRAPESSSVFVLADAQQNTILRHSILPIITNLRYANQAAVSDIPPD
jgi:hypothetical protein